MERLASAGADEAALARTHNLPLCSISLSPHSRLETVFLFFVLSELLVGLCDVAGTHPIMTPQRRCSTCGGIWDGVLHAVANGHTWAWGGVVAQRGIMHVIVMNATTHGIPLREEETI